LKIAQEINGLLLSHFQDYVLKYVQKTDPNSVIFNREDVLQLAQMALMLTIQAVCVSKFAPNILTHMETTQSISVYLDAQYNQIFTRIRSLKNVF
jgi:hypothetical protein